MNNEIFNIYEDDNGNFEISLAQNKPRASWFSIYVENLVIKREKDFFILDGDEILFENSRFLNLKLFEKIDEDKYDPTSFYYTKRFHFFGKKIKKPCEYLMLKERGIFHKCIHVSKVKFDGYIGCEILKKALNE